MLIWIRQSAKGEKLVIHNQTFDENNPTGTIKLFGGNHRGCDSTIQVQLNFYPIAASQLDTSVCTAGKIIIHNQTFDEMHTSGVIVLPGQITLDAILRFGHLQDASLFTVQSGYVYLYQIIYCNSQSTLR